MEDGERYLLDKRLVLVDDEPDLLEMVASIFRQRGFSDVAAFGDAFAALVSCRKAAQEGRAPQLLVLDVMMPGMDGFSLLGELRGIRGMERVPAVFLTARDEPTDRISGLSQGADDYIAKPFLPQELVLRVLAVLRRCYANESPALDLGFARVNLATAEVERPDGVVMLTAKECEILSALAANRGRIVTVDELSEACWGGTFGYGNTLMAHIRRLREKVEADPSRPAAIVTVKGLGYRLMDGAR